MAPGHVRCAGARAAFEEGEGVEVVSPHGAQHIWTRKQAGIPIRGTLLGRPFEGRGFVDDTAGYHARHTAWRWSAGVGVAESGAPVAWNLVDGVHDGLQASERTVWVDGTPHRGRPAAVRATTSPRSGICAASRLRCASHRERLLLLSSEYEMPFGRFSGSLPHAGPLREGWGVMERHRVRW